jgi:protein arginine N-methyltransferase 3
VGYFDCLFAHPNAQDELEQQTFSPVSFSTGPFTTATHWKQTLFILKEALEVQSGDYVKGIFRCNKALDNPRELEIGISYWVTHDKDQDPPVESMHAQSFYLR